MSSFHTATEVSLSENVFIQLQLLKLHLIHMHEQQFFLFQEVLRTFSKKSKGKPARNT